MPTSSKMNLRVNELSFSGQETMVRRFDHEDLLQLQKLHQFSFVTDEDLHGRNVLPFSLYRYVKAH